MHGPTKRQSEIIRFIREHRNQYSAPPSIAEIGRRFGISRQGAHKHIKQMEKKELVKLENDNKQRDLVVHELVDRYQLVRNHRHILVFKYGELEIPATEFLGHYFRIVET